MEKHSLNNFSNTVSQVSSPKLAGALEYIHCIFAVGQDTYHH